MAAEASAAGAIDTATGPSAASQQVAAQAIGVATGADAAPENIESTQGLNGAQINAALTILAGVVEGTTAATVAVELLLALGVQRERAERMVNDTVNQPKPETKPVNDNPFEDEDDEEAAADDTKALKEFDDTRSEFVAAVMDTIEAAQDGDMPRRRFGIVMRANLRRLGTQAFQDGLEDGGVDAADMDDRDRAAVQEWLRIQSPFVTNFAARVFSNELSEAQVEAHANMWGNKSLRDAYQLGQASSQWNKMVMWVVGPTEDSCPDCQRLNGQRHRFRDFKKKGWLPGAEKLECTGKNCLCQFVPAPGERAFGRF